MKKQYIISFIFLLICIYLKGQSEAAKGKITYNFIFKMDTVRDALSIETESFLYFDSEKKQSIYVWSRKSKSKTRELIRLDDGTSFVRVKNGGSDTIGNIVFKNYQNLNIVERALGQPVKIISDSYNINWQISEETKTIKEMILQKAECDFRGRHYTAWFNPKIPIPDGPWKLRGLPGLIVEAHDEKKHVQFNFTSLTLPADFTEKIEAPSDGTPAVYDCVKFTEAHYKLVRELGNAMTGKVQQLGGTVQGGGGYITNIIERCY